MNPTPSADLPLVIGLLGGIAAGKSTVSRIFAEHGFQVLDADLIARGVVAKPACQARIRDRFGGGVFAADGSLHREALAERVFGDEKARHDLEAIVIPEVRATLLEGLATARAAGISTVLDVPLLLEHGLIEECDHCVFLDVGLETREERARARGWKDGELRQREASQASLEAKRARCGFVMATGGSVVDTHGQVLDILRSLGGFGVPPSPPDQPNS